MKLDLEKIKSTLKINNRLIKTSRGLVLAIYYDTYLSILKNNFISYAESEDT